MNLKLNAEIDYLKIMLVFIRLFIKVTFLHSFDLSKENVKMVGLSPKVKLLMSRLLGIEFK